MFERLLGFPYIINNLTKNQKICIIFLYLPYGEARAINTDLTKRTDIKKLVTPILGILLLVAASIFIILLNLKAVTVTVDGKDVKFSTFQGTVREALEKKDIYIGEKDRTEPGLDTKLEDNSSILVKRAVNLKVLVDEKEINVKSAENSIDEMLKAEAISMNGEDRVKPEKSTSLSEGMIVEVTRVETKLLSETVAIKFKEVVQNNSRLPNTKRDVTREGKDGEKKVTTAVVYENGKEVSRKAVESVIVKEPVDRLIVQGTYPLMPVSRGAVMPYSRVFNSRATAYWAVRGVGKTYTASGRKAVRNPDGYSTIAVDPSVIPYGSKLFVEGYGFAIAADCGTAIKGEKIDVYFNTKREALDWAVKYVNVYVLK